jgi:hypothetical protein
MFFIRRLSVLLIFTLLLSCASTDEKTTTLKQGQSSSATVTFVNNTPFRAHITLGSMAVELKPIEPGGKIVTANVYNEAEAFYFSFDIPLLPNSFDILNVRPLNTGAMSILTMLYQIRK